MNQLVTTSLSEITASTGGGGGGITFDVAVRAEGQSTTSSSYSNLSYSNVSATQYGTFTQGINTLATGSGGPDPATASNTVQWEFDTDGIYYIEFVSYGQTTSGGFQFASVHKGGASNVHEETLCWVGIYANYNRKTATAIRKFESGDVLKFFTNLSNGYDKVSRILISKVG